MKSKRVLIVDDNDLNRKLFENLVGQYYSFESAINGLEAVDFARKSQFDLILMDIQMPQMDGISAMKKIRRENSHLGPIIAVTAFAEESDSYHFINQGFDDFILKPIRTREFLETLKKFLNGKTDPCLEAETAEAHHLILDRSVIHQLMKYNSKEIIASILNDFLKECKEIEEAFSLNDNNKTTSDLTEKLHILKGNSGTLGAQRIFAASAQAEALAKSGDNQKLEEELEKLKNEIRIFGKYIHEESIFEP
jgi:two-component system, OmpR family, alkaline phosphatase synthesis response regulator PhoP